MAKIKIMIMIMIIQRSESQQPFLNNKQLDCDNTFNSSTLGYSCSSSDLPSCPSFLFFRLQPNFQTPSQISNLFSSDPTSIIINHDQAVVPVSCSCTKARHYQSNTNYTVKISDQNYFSIANETFQGLTTCQALMDQNPAHKKLELYPGVGISVPLRCACPSAGQRSAGIRFLLTYIITYGETIELISDKFRVDPQAVLDANSLNLDDTIYPFNSLLIPLSSPPSPSDLISPDPNPDWPSPPPVSSPTAGIKSDKKGLIIGIVVGVFVVVILGVSAGCFWILIWRKRHDRDRDRDHEHDQDQKKLSMSDRPLEEKIRAAMIKSAMMRYSFDELEKATNGFSDENRIKSSSVYRGVIGDDVVAVKRTTDDVQREIGVLGKINHSNIVRLTGFCCRRADSFLVYEFDGFGSLNDLLHHHDHDHHHNHYHRDHHDLDSRLDWCRRVRIACDVADALNYLHSGVKPAIVHMNVKSSNVLLGREFRAKLGNFAVARQVELGGSGPAELTAHVVGTRGYLAPEYLEHGLVSTKLDVFAFGVVLIELISGKSAEEKKEETLTAAVRNVVEGEDAREKVTRFMDPRLDGEFPFELAFAMAQLAARCVAEDYNSRPSAGELLVALTAIHTSSMDWDSANISRSDSVSEPQT